MTNEQNANARNYPVVIQIVGDGNNVVVDAATLRLTWLENGRVEEGDVLSGSALAPSCDSTITTSSVSGLPML